MPGSDRPRRGQSSSWADGCPGPKPSPADGDSAAQSEDLDHDSDLSDAIQTAIEKLLTDGVFVSKLVTAIKAKLVNELSSSICSEVKASLKFDIDNANDKMSSLEKRIDQFEEDLDEAEQYCRRNCLVFAGINESEDEDTETAVIDICRDDLGISVEKNDIDRCHQLGPLTGAANKENKTNKTRKQHRDVIVKFASYRTRDAVYKARFNLRKISSKSKTVFINESLTKNRSKLYWKVRRGLNSKDFKLWTQDGKIIVKKPNGGKVTIVRDKDLSKVNLNT